ncbi:MAG TPA: ABC transporter permease subunit [Candidatus Ozemobacteraceae bacterium]|nr:ABC transporter permease subunit [Candidatus Ozemobacteraceae bacterium]
MRRLMVLFAFELKKVLARKKAILFLLALNVVPILASIAALLAYLKMRSLGLGSIEYSMLVEMVQALFTAHMKLFAWISPFFLALVVGDILSGEAGRGHLKTLLLTPVARWQVLLAKAAAVMIFLLMAVALGGLFLQIDLWVAHSMSQSGAIIMDIRDTGAVLADSRTALRLLTISFMANLAMVAYFLLTALFFETPILMAFVSLIILMTMQTYVLMAPYLMKLDDAYARWLPWCFTRHLSQLTDLQTINGVLNQSLMLTSSEVWEPLTGSLGWAGLFLALAMFVFHRRQFFS